MLFVVVFEVGVVSLVVVVVVVVMLVLGRCNLSFSLVPVKVLDTATNTVLTHIQTKDLV